MAPPDPPLRGKGGSSSGTAVPEGLARAVAGARTRLRWKRLRRRRREAEEAGGGRLRRERLRLANRAGEGEAAVGEALVWAGCRQIP